ncbi:MAG: hypothetical protein IJY93_04175 [Clostridia bacterium]|nr:hypothetical protein [Clostridia bacterium]
MNLLQYVAAYTSLMILMKKEFPYTQAYELVKLKRRLSPKVEYYAAEEAALVKRFAKCDERGEPIINGTRFDCKGDTPEEVAVNTREFECLRRELGSVVDDAEIERVKVTLSDDIMVSPEVIEALEAFIDFEVT